jgi:hypothetical protein
MHTTLLYHCLGETKIYSYHMRPGHSHIATIWKHILKTYPESDVRECDNKKLCVLEERLIIELTLQCQSRKGLLLFFPLGFHQGGTNLELSRKNVGYAVVGDLKGHVPVGVGRLATPGRAS